MRITLVLSLGLTLTTAGQVRAADDRPRAVPTFACVGLYWRPPSGAADKPCQVYFRPTGRDDWREAMPLWFDATEHPGSPEHSREYRGSIVGLESDTSYEIKLMLRPEGEERRLTVRTWREQFLIARTVVLPERIEGTYAIADGGSETAGYVLYTSPPGRRTLFDGHRTDEINIRVTASHVILRGLDLKGARRHGIDLGAVNHVVIEDCDISGWGDSLEDGWGRNLDSAIYHTTPDNSPRMLRQIVIQNNRLHHPHSNSNSWTQRRPSRNNNPHPIGPQAISFVNPDGELVIRHNDIYSDFEHMFNDAMGEVRNFSYAGFPGRDSDVYGNRVSHCWDDALEIEGANMNVRIWANVIDWTFDGIGCATTSLGPCYLFRNIYLHSRKAGGTDDDSYKGQGLVKLGGEPKDAEFSNGRIYLFHNTALQPPAWGGYAATSGAARGLQLTSRTKHQTNIVSRNNVLWLRDSRSSAIYDAQTAPDNATNDFDHDLFIGSVTAVQGSEAHGIRSAPSFSAPADLRRPWTVALAPGSPGHDQAFPLPNFNDGFAGKGPDLGAIESGRSIPADFPTGADRPLAGPESTGTNGIPPAGAMR